MYATRVALAFVVVGIGACGSSGHKSSTPAGPSTSPTAAHSSPTPLTLAQVKANLQKAGYRVTVYTPDEGALYIDASHKASAGFSVDYSPDGQRIYGTVYETSNPAVRAAILAHSRDEPTPFVRGDLIFTLSGTAPELQKIVADSGDASSSNAPSGPGSSADIGAVKASVQRFIAVYAAADEKRLCASFTPQALAKSKTFCDPASIFYKRQPDPRVKQYSVTTVTITGDTATATVNFQGATEDLALRKLGGQWKIDTELGAGRLF